MPKYQVEFIQYTSLECFEIEADSKKEANNKGFAMLMKYDRDNVDATLVNELDEDGVIIESEKIVKQIDEEEN